MSFAVDLALLVNFIAARSDHLGFERQIAARQSNAVKLQLEVSLAPEVTGILGGFEMSDEVTATRKGLLTKLGDSAKVAKNGVPDIDGGRGKVRFIEGTLQKSTGGQ